MYNPGPVKRERGSALRKGDVSDVAAEEDLKA
jgi:hypothetical protein